MDCWFAVGLSFLETGIAVMPLTLDDHFSRVLCLLSIAATSEACILSQIADDGAGIESRSSAAGGGGSSNGMKKDVNALVDLMNSL